MQPHWLTDTSKSYEIRLGQSIKKRMESLRIFPFQTIQSQHGLFSQLSHRSHSFRQMTQMIHVTGEAVILKRTDLYERYNYMMSKNKTIFFKKTHKLFISTLVLHTNLHYHCASRLYADSENIRATTVIQPNKTVDVITIDSLQSAEENIDKEVTVAFYLLDGSSKHLQAKVQFDLSREKIISPNSSEVFKKTIKEGCGLVEGFIQYKFVSMTTQEISQKTFQELQKHKHQVNLLEKNMEIDEEYRRLLQIIQEKDGVIAVMSEQIDRLTKETKKMSSNMRDQSMSKDSKNPISLNINLKPSNQIEFEHRKLTKENESLKAKIFKMTEIIERLREEKHASEKQIETMREVLKTSSKGDKGEKISDEKYDDKSSIINRLEAQFSKSDRPIEPPWMKRNNFVSSYSEVNRKLSHEDQLLRVQIERANTFDDISADKAVLLTKLKGSVVEIQLLQKEVEELRVYIKKLTDELKILRKNNTKEGIMAKIEAIRSENEKVIEQLKSQGRLTLEQELFTHQRQKWMIETEILKKELEDLNVKYNHASSESKIKEQEAEKKIHKLQTRQIELAKERDIYKAQLAEAKAKLEKSSKKEIALESVGVSTLEINKSVLLTKEKGSSKSLDSQNHPANQRDISKNNSELLKMQASQMQDYKRLESLNKMLNQKITNYEEEIAKYDKKFTELRNYVKTIEITLRTKGKYDNEELYEAEVMQQLKNFEEEIVKAEEEYYSEQFDVLKGEKDKMIEYYYNAIAQVKKEIDNDPNLTPIEKKIRKDKREAELRKEKNAKLSEIQKKMSKVQTKQKELKHVSIQKMKSVPERLATIQKMLIASEAQRKEKQSLEKFNKIYPAMPNLVDSVIVRDDSSKNPIKEGQSIGAGTPMKTSEVLMKGSASIREFTTRYTEEWGRIIENSRKQMRQAMEENNKLRLNITEISGKLQKQRLQKQREIANLVREFKEKQGKFEVAKMSSSKEKELLQKKIEQLTADCNQRKEIIEEHQKAINQLENELTSTNDELNKKIMQNGELETRNKNLLDQLNQLTKLQKDLVGQIQELNKINLQNKNQFQRLLEQRSNAFSRIEEIRKAEIDRLGRIREELQFRIQNQINDSIKVKGENSQLFNQNNQLVSQNKQYQQSLIMIKENYEKQIASLYQKLKMYEDVNLQLQKNLMTLAEDYNNLQERAATIEIEKQAMQKQIEAFKHLQNDIKELQQKREAEKKDLEYIIIDKKEQLKKMETDFIIFQEKMKMVGEENQRVRSQASQRELNIQNLREKVNQKSLQILKMAEEKSIVSIEKVKLQNQIQGLNKQLQKLRKELSHLSSENNDLRQRLRLSQEEVSQIQRRYSQPQQNQPPKMPESLSPNKEMLEVLQPYQISRNLSSHLLKSDDNSPPPQFQDKFEQVIKVQKIEQQHTPPKKSESIGRKNSLVRIDDKNEEVISDRSFSSKKSALSRQKSEKFYFTDTPPQISEKKGISYEREIELMRQINELSAEKKELQDHIALMQSELAQLKQLAIKKSYTSQDYNIKIDEFSSQENTVEGTISHQHNKLNLSESANLHQTNRSGETDYSLEMKNLEVMVEDLQKEKLFLMQKLEQYKSNEEKLHQMEEQFNLLDKECSQKIQELQRQFQQKSIECDNLKQDYEEKIESILSQLMSKDEKLAQALHELENTHHKVSVMQQQLSKLETQIQDKERVIYSLEETIKKLKISYRKYEEQAELQILTLREKIQEVVQYNKDKDRDLIEMGEKYLNLEDGADHQYNEMKKLQLEIQNITKTNMRLDEQNKKVGQQREEFNANRKKLLGKIHQLQIQLINKNQEIAQANKNAALATAKSNIKIQNMEEALADMRKRQEDKDRVVTTLKNQIAHYNDECLVLKKANEDLDFELQRVSRQLKDIVVHYQTQFEELNKHKKSFSQTLKNSDTMLKEKQKVINCLRVQLRQSERQRNKVEGQLKEVKGQYEHFKLIKQKQYNDKCNEYEFKNNEYELMKTAYQKIVEENYCNETKIDEEREKYSRLYTDYKAKMANYEQILNDLSKEIALLAGGPSKEQTEQALFENQMFRSRIKELEDELKKSRTSKKNSSQEQLQIEFRKYKANKQALIHNLETQMENYSAKVSEFEEANFYLKREVETLRGKLTEVSDEKYDLQEEIDLLEKDIEELKEELQFYKGKRRQGLTKLLHETEG